MSHTSAVYFSQQYLFDVGKNQIYQTVGKQKYIERVVLLSCQPSTKPEVILEKKISQRMRPAFEREIMMWMKWGQAHPAGPGPEFGSKVYNDVCK